MRGDIALISAGWRHDEASDEPLREAIGEAVGSAVRNLALYQRFRLLEREAAELMAAYARKQALLKRVKERYRLAIIPALGACRDLYARRRDPTCGWFAQSIENICAIDRIFLDQADRLHAAFAEEARPSSHPRVRAAIDELRAELDKCAVVLIGGGHVGVLRNRLLFFEMDTLLQQRRVVAWSAGAMALTERVLLFHDHTTYGVGLAELLDRGLGMLPGVVFLPHARERLNLQDVDNVAILARRLAPARVIGLENGAALAGARLVNVGAHAAAFVLRPNGSVGPISEVHAPAP